VITKIKRLKSIGKFYDFSSKGDGLDWCKTTFLYAPNAYGKSTLVNVCRSLQSNSPQLIKARRTLGADFSPEAVVIVEGVNHVFNGTKWDRACPTIQIFDVPFIHENILSHAIEHSHRKNIHRIIIGAQGITLAEQLAKLKGGEKGKRQRLDDLSNQFTMAQITQYPIAKFLSISSDEEAHVQDRILKLEQQIKSKESETVVRGLSCPQPLSAPYFDLTLVNSLVTQILASTHDVAEKRVLDHIRRNFSESAKAKEFIRLGVDLIQVDCPFCGQDLNNAASLLAAYREFFDDTFRNYESNLKQQAEALNEWNIDNSLTTLVSDHNVNVSIVKQWEPFIGVATLPDAPVIVEEARRKLKKLKAAVLLELGKKEKDPNSDVDTSQFDLLTAGIASLKGHIEAYNTAVAELNNRAKKYIGELPTSDIASIRLALTKEREIEKRFKPEWKKWVVDYEFAKKDAEDLSKEKTNKQKELEDYSRTIFSTYQKRINELLFFLGTDFAVTDLSGKTDARANESYSEFGFLILKQKVPLTARQDDMPCFKTTLSEGDKSTLAFAFFIAALEKLPDIKDQIVILDDPLSSLDETRREATARVLLELSPKVKQLCVFTHKKDFLGMLFDKMPDSTVLQVRYDKTNGSRLEALDVEEDRKSDYVRMVEEMMHYVTEDFGPTPDSMQGNIRKMFEIVLKTKYYCALASDIKARKGFGKLLECLFEAGLIDSALKPKLFDLCNLTNGPHHGEIVDAPSRKLTRDELIPLIQESLTLLRRV
jgi:wobble nucleotide-excising tRNase